MVLIGDHRRLAYGLATWVAQAYRMPGPLIDAQAPWPAKAMFWINDRIIVVRGEGLVSAYDMKDGEQFGLQLFGATVGTGAAAPRYIFPMGNRIMVIDQTGATSYHTVANRVVSQATPIADSRIATDAAPVKGVFALGDEIAVLNAAGELWVHPVGNVIGPARNVPGGIANKGAPIKGDRKGVRNLNLAEADSTPDDRGNPVGLVDICYALRSAWPLRQCLGGRRSDGLTFG